MEMPERNEPRPVILCKMDALGFAAERLERMASDCDLAAIIIGVFDKSDKERPADLTAKMRELNQALPEPALQAKALREGAKTIRDLILEERLVAARASQHGIRERTE